MSGAAPLRLITSAAYVAPELSAEFGRIPPSFLPVGVSRLYEAQIASLGPGGPIHLSLPEGFVPQAFDRQRLRDLDVILVPVPEDLTLGESIVHAVNYIDGSAGPMTLLHGDTLIDDLPGGGGDLIAVHHEGDDYGWAAVQVADGLVAGLEVIEPGSGYDDPRPVACGYFAFANRSELVRSITRARGSFVAGLNDYVSKRPVQAPQVARWRDFGHIQTYFRSRRAVSTARAFNRIDVDAHAVVKSSGDRAKICAEAAWFDQLPPAVRPFTARFLGLGGQDHEACYRTEYQYAPTLAELYVFGLIGRPSWRNILRSCHDFLSTCAGFVGPGEADAALGELAVGKTLARLEAFAAASGFDIDRGNRLDGCRLPSLRRIAVDLAEAIDLRTGRRESVMHGDLCLSNILYNSRSARISVIDPRGSVFAGRNSIFGDPRYDLAKLAHSLVGCYDQILAGRYGLQRPSAHEFALSFETSPHNSWVQQAFAEFEVDGLRTDSLSVRAITAGLFLSMLPLHADRPDRQAAFIANALRLYAGLAAA